MNKKYLKKGQILCTVLLFVWQKKTLLVEFQQAAGKPCLATTLIYLICPQHFDFEIWICCIYEKYG